MTVEDDAPLLFGVEELRLDPGRRGRAEAGLMRALRAAHDAGRLVEEDAGMVGAALVAARALDQAETYAGPKTPYAVQAAMPPLIVALQALRLPAAVAPVADPPAPGPGGSGVEVPDWLRDSLGPQ